MQKTFFDSKGEIVRLGQRVGGGGEGEVYEAQDRRDLVAKIYYETPSAEKRADCRNSPARPGHF